MATFSDFCNATACGICTGDQYTAMSVASFTEAQISIMCTGANSLLGSTYNNSLTSAEANAQNYISANIVPQIQGLTEGLNCTYLFLCAALVFVMHGGFAMVSMRWVPWLVPAPVVNQP